MTFRNNQQQPQQRCSSSVFNYKYANCIILLQLFLFASFFTSPSSAFNLFIGTEEMNRTLGGFLNMDLNYTYISQIYIKPLFQNIGKSCCRHFRPNGLRDERAHQRVFHPLPVQSGGKHQPNTVHLEQRWTHGR
jgi:hypothetical protein